jgi:signal transduction histidine kinase
VPDTSLKTKLTWVIMLTCGILLLILSCIVLVAEIYASKQALKQDLHILANSLAPQLSQPLLLEQRQVAERSLTALSRQANIHAAYLFDRRGEPFAEYLKPQQGTFVVHSLRQDFPATERAQLDEQYFSSLQHLSLLVPVTFEGQAVGGFYLLSDLDPLYGRLSGTVFGMLTAFLLLLLASWFLARWMHKPVSGPLLNLAGLMQEVAVSRNYAIRAEKVSQDEIGVLVDGFNQMLQQIEAQRDSLARYQHQLESRVAQRTEELRETVDQLQEARQQAVEANAAKSDFLAKMTHELRTPLIGVLGMNELILRSSLDERQKMLVQTVQKSGEDLLRLISDVLDFSRIEAGKLTLETRPLELAAVIEEVVDLLYPQAREKGIDLRTEIPFTALWKVSGDEVRLRQIVMNLLGNAIKFTSSGSVRLVLRCLEVGDDRQGQFLLQVADTGIGMDENARQQIFEVFSQLDNQHNREKSGAGLGLAIVKQLVDLMGGTLDFSSVPGTGTTFNIQLPLLCTEKVQFELPHGLRGNRLLLCCPEDAVAVELSHRFTDLGLRVEQADSGSTAIDQLRAGHRDADPCTLYAVHEEVEVEVEGRLYQALAREAVQIAGRPIVITRSRDMATPGEAVHLPLPLKWSALHFALCRSWQGLRSIAPAAVERLPPTQGDDSETGIWLLSAHVASRELMRLTLEKHLQRTVMADAPSLLKRLTEFGGAPELVCVDTAHQSDAELLQLLQLCASLAVPVVLCAECKPSAEVAALVDRVVLKPLRADELVTAFAALAETRSERSTGAEVTNV